MTKEVDLLKKRIEKSDMKRQALLVELSTLKKLVSEKRRDKDLQEIEKLKEKLLGNI